MFDPKRIVQVVAKTDDGKSWLMAYDPDTGRLTVHKEIVPPPFGRPIPTMALAGTLAPTFEELYTQKRPEPERPERIDQSMEDSVFRARLASIMTDNMYDRRLRGRTRGKLDMRRLWKAETGATNLFTQKLARKNKEYNILLLVDESGSMGSGTNSKMYQAAQISTFLAKTFEGLNLNLAIVGFNSFVHLHKGFDEKVKDYPLLQQTILHGPNYGGDTNYDYEALAYAYRMFTHRTKGQNFLIMLSDGKPTEDSIINVIVRDPEKLKEAIKAGDDWAITTDYSGRKQVMWVDTSTKLTATERNSKKHLHALVQANPNVTSIGIGIQTDSWQIPNHIRENDLKQLKPVLLREIQKQIKRG